MKQETLEEFKKRFANGESHKNIKLDYQDGIYYGIEVGAKWQSKRMYSEEEVKMLAFNFYYDMSHKMGVAENLISENATNVDVWFEKLKKG